MAYLPGGAELSDEEDDYYLDDTDDYFYGKNNNVINTSAVSEKIEIKTKPKRNVLLASLESNSTLAVNDVRMAIINNNFDHLRQLIEGDSELPIDIPLSADWTPLMIAAKYGRKEIVTYLLERGANPNHNLNKTTPLMAICAANDINEDNLIDCANYIIESGGDVNMTDNSGNTALIYAAKSGMAGLTQKFIDSKADANHRNNDGWNALHWSVREGHGKVIARLLDSNCDINLLTNLNKTVAQIADSRGHYKIKEILDNISQRESENEINESTDKRLTPEELETLENYMRPVVEIKCRERNKPIETKIVNTDLEDFLVNSDLHYLLPEFDKKGLSYHDLVTNTEQVLDKIGVDNVYVRRKMMTNINLMHKQEWKRESIKELPPDVIITCPDVMCIMSNISSHLVRIDQTITFMKKKIEAKPELMSLKNDVTTSRQVFNETLQTLINCRQLYEDVQAFRRLITSIEDISEPQTPEILSLPANIEDEMVSNVNRKSSKLLKSLIFGVISIGTVTIYTLKFKPNIPLGSVLKTTSKFFGYQF
ncbi:ankyrin repeat, SAM and basic leucine zipper domain-containing protein 1-like [Oppia nitens]|uniref:ankyrin repeat, SAM and basic leucine zipper domain-containing protein 1-like n=1 Tax=Oppia nitens TaxID=1686743 RepID=UPI0023DAF270|nr:ankyrin repeat, SAM and basic leucine zipper domain-containing protein 1-like [Oppia nitens]